MGSMRPFGLSALLALLATAGMATGTSVRLLNLPDMVRLADRVFLGLCLSAENQPGESISASVVEYVFEVRQGIKGVQNGERVIFRQVRSEQTGVKGIPGIPTYRSGEEILLFLHADSRIGLTSPVGLSQGVFHWEEAGDGKMGLLNSLHNRNLPYRMGVESAQDLGISRVELHSLQEVGPIPIEIFTSLVRRIDFRHALKGRSPQ
jgi:hypothetical protein